jgi:hypothetical protein
MRAQLIKIVTQSRSHDRSRQAEGCDRSTYHNKLNTSPEVK